MSARHRQTKVLEIGCVFTHNWVEIKNPTENLTNCESFKDFFGSN